VKFSTVEIRTHALLLEAGVFLVSVKLIMMAYQISVSTQQIQDELKSIRSLLEQQNKSE